jgi:adenine-specific DNA-methyltransferase
MSQRKRTLQRRTPRGTPSPAQNYRHADARRKNNPPAGIAPTYEACERQKKPYTNDPHLVWASKAEHTSFKVDLVAFHIHERIYTRDRGEAGRRDF